MLAVLQLIAGCLWMFGGVDNLRDILLEIHYTVMLKMVSEFQNCSN
jgi:hypothetical protein